MDLMIGTCVKIKKKSNIIICCHIMRCIEWTWVNRPKDPCKPKVHPMSTYDT